MEVLQNFHNYHIVVVGCGGTGSNLVPHLAQLANSYQDEKISIVLADEDVVEPGNIGRQFFIEPDVGNNKAGVLQKRYLAAWGVEISYYPYYIRDAQVLLKLLEIPASHGHRSTLPILVGCVDNHKSRRVFHEVFYQMDTIAYVDGGNSFFSGQVVLGLKIGGKEILKPLSEYYPDVMTTDDDISVGGTCGRKTVKEPQSLIANLWSAATILSFINNIIGVKKIPSYMTTFNAHNILCRPEYIRWQK
ncbi:MAG: thiamine biosynthesis protein ThiF [Pelotomaculum sp. PtaB.Bin013]|nr:MAG: thiamine biosynthesis protein ThiF [Pelotomaculum sp. PtaB.Bin013]